ncbi:MAG: GIY-YIG nuclease family protein [Patescibacteria group bacterium]
MKDLPHFSVSKQSLIKIPNNPGIYIFGDENLRPIYIGKAKSLKARLSSYFLLNLLPKTKSMLKEAKFISFIEVNNEFEAFLLEANLVRKYLPHYNIQLKDDKTPLYIIITKEEFPRIITARKTQLETIVAKNIFGPFLSGLVVRKVLSRLRKIFPYSNHKLGRRACIYNQIGLCDPCPNEINKIEDQMTRKELTIKYLSNINRITKILSGNIAPLKKELEREMNKAAKLQDFEGARQVHNQILQLDYITTQRQDSSSYIQNPSLVEDLRERELVAVKQMLEKYFNITKLIRIECFDIAHLAGSFPTGSMVTFVGGEPDKRFYRHFNVKTKLGGDTDRLAEILTRRTKRFADWGVPDLIIIDGGKPQISAVSKIMPKNIPVVGIAKRFETLVVEQDGKFIEERLKPPALYLFQRLRDESHRFSRRLHHKQISKLFNT